MKYFDDAHSQKIGQFDFAYVRGLSTDPQKAHDFDRHLTLQKLYYRPEGLYQNTKGLWDTCKKVSYSFPFTDVKKWLDRQAMYQIFRLSPKHIPYASYSKIMKPNTVHQCDLIKISYDEDVNTNLLDDGGGPPIYYYVLLVIDCATRYCIKILFF